MGFYTVAQILSGEAGEVTEIDFDNPPPLRLISTSTTRWLAFADCCERIIQQVSWVLETFIS